MDIASMLEVQVNEVKEVDSKENVTPGDLVPSTTNVAPPVTEEMSTVFKLLFSNDIASVRFHKLHCTACDAHIGSAPSQANNMFEHPVLHTLICAECRNFYGDGTFEQGDDATDMFCRWCANGGNLYCCSYCSNTFCYNCIRRNFDAVVCEQIEADEKWKCFVCDPIELSPARAICWALLQHVQTVTRILQNNRKMSREEIEDKMSLDESQCCPRKRKRKWRKNCSPVVPFSNNRVKKPVVTRRRSLNNATSYVRVLPMGSQSASAQKGSVRQHNLTLPALPCEQNDAESPMHALNNVTVSAASKNSEQSVSLHCDRPPTYHSPSLITAVPTASLLQNPPPQVIHPQSSSYSSSTPMIAIPNQNANQMLNHQQVALPKPKRSAAMMVTPNIIDLDSDSDEPTVVEAPPVTHVIIDDDVDIVNVVPAPAVPVALVSNGHIHNGIYSSTDAVAVQGPNNPLNALTNKSTCGVSDNMTNIAAKDSPLREMSTRIEEQPKPFSHILLPHTTEVETILKKLKLKFAKLFEGPKDNYSDARANKIARNLVMHFYRDICITVKELATINDRVIREYNTWKRIHEDGGHVQPIIKRRKRRRHNSTDIYLDMGCMNESDTEESDSSDNPEDSIIIPSELIGATNALEDVLLFKKLNTVDRGTGDRSIISNDKSVQVHTGNEGPLIPADVEQGIGYSVVRKNNRKRGRKCSIQRNNRSNARTGQFEEQFIYYLQHIEDHGIETDDLEEPSEPKELTSLLGTSSPKQTNNDATDAQDKTDVTTPEAPSEIQEMENPLAEDNDVPDEIIVIEEVESVEIASGDASPAHDDSATAVNESTDNRDSNECESSSIPLSVENCSANNETSLTTTAPMKYEDKNKSNSYLTDADVEEDCTIIDY